MAPARLYYGLTEIKLGNVEVGKKEIEEAVRINPGYTRAHLALGKLHLKSNDPVSAEREALEVLRRNPTSLDAF
ncbi:MAG: hypothetical protein GTO08_01800, partial [Deltaproteobacteria bacterium]|nr:hypothetical protein [Deltaproteobacteria bacterium]